MKYLEFESKYDAELEERKIWNNWVSKFPKNRISNEELISVDYLGNILPNAPKTKSIHPIIETKNGHAIKIIERIDFENGLIYLDEIDRIYKEF